MKQIANSPELRETLNKAADKSLKSLAVEFGGNVAAVESVNGALGFVAELERITNVRRYGSVGLSLGLPSAQPAAWLLAYIPHLRRITAGRS